ncbi:MAG: rhodanese-like domain-containing protein [Vulcanimicrobiota bacterium]
MITALRAFFLINVACALAFASYATGLSKVTLFQPVLPPPQSEFENLSVQQARQIQQDQPEVLFVDARSRPGYDFNHLPGAISLPVASTVDNTNLERLRRAPLVVVYCDSSHCGAALKLAQKLSQMGLGPIKVMEDGMEGWLQSGLPTEKS